MSSFTPAETAYLKNQRLGRLETVGADGQPLRTPLLWARVLRLHNRHYADSQQRPGKVRVGSYFLRMATWADFERISS